LSAVPSGDFYTVSIGYPTNLGRYLVEKGSVAVEGISLTISALTNDHLDIAVIPKTWKMTRSALSQSRRPRQSRGGRDRQIRRAVVGFQLRNICKCKKGC
jgi:hypothetical protein